MKQVSGQAKEITDSDIIFSSENMKEDDDETFMNIVFVTMLYAVSKIKKENIIDALRDEMT